MKTFKQWLKEKKGIDLPNGNINGSWFHEHHLPMIVKCTCCESTMCIVSCNVDDKGQVYCGSCSECEEEN